MSNHQTRQHLLGTWKLITAVREEVSSGTKTEFLGPNPVGYINYGADGRMLVLTVAITHHVDVSWNQRWTGTDQKRVARFEGNRVYLSTPPSLDPITGTTSVRTMTWEKLG